MKKLLLITLFFSFISVLNANDGKPGTIIGKVTDVTTGEVLIGTNIGILGTSFGTSSNVEGEYTIHNIKPGTYTVVYRYIGYQDVDMSDVKVEPGETLELNIQMTPMSESLGEVIVSIQARGQMAAINQERAATGITNIVSSDKIKEVPDANAAESIGRLPGVSLKRSGGEGSQVVIRGLSPQFSIIEIDGVRMTGSGGDRSVGLSSVSSEMLDGIELSKSLTADKDADAIGGIVNLRTATAAEGFHVGAMARGGYNGLDKNFADYKYTGSISNRFFDNKFGALLNVSNERVNRSSDRANFGYSGTDTIADPDPNSPVFQDKIYQLVTNSANIEVQKSIRYRTNGNLALDYKNDFMHIRSNNIYSQMTMDNENRNNAYQLNRSGGEFEMVTNRTSPKEQMRSHSINGLFKILTTELDITYAYSKTNYENFIDVYTIHDKDPLYPEYESANGGSGISYIDRIFTNPNELIDTYYNIGSYGDPSFRDNRRDTLDRQDISNVLNVNWKIPFALSDNLTGKIKMGFKYSTKNRKSDKSRIRSAIADGGIGTDRRNSFYSLYPDMIRWEDIKDGSDEIGLPGQNFIDENYDWGSVLNGEYDLGWGPDLPYLIETHDAYYGQDTDKALYTIDAIESYKDDYEVSEKLMAGYLMAEVNIGKKIMLLPGVRYELMQTVYSSYYSIEDAFSPNRIKIGYPIPVSVDDRKNAHLFPSLNMKIEATDWMDIRAAYYKSTSRPNYSLLSPGITSDQDLIKMQAYNPYLEPSTAHNYDFGVSFFTPKVGLFSVNIFYKEMTDLLYRLPKYQPKWFDQLVVGDNVSEGEIPAALYESLQAPRALYPEEFIDPLKNPEMNSYPINNPNKATIKGIELSWQTNFWYLPGMLKGIVFEFNYSYIQSEYEVPYIDFKKELDPSVPFPLYIDVPIYATEHTIMPDQPSSTFNARLGWDYRGFSTRLSFRYETAKQTGFDPIKQLTDKYTASLFRMDLNAVQRLGKGFAVSLDIMNLTNSMDERYYNTYNARITGYETYRTNLEHYGLTAQLGLKYNF